MKNLNRITIILLTALAFLVFIGCSKKTRNVSKVNNEEKSNILVESESKVSELEVTEFSNDIKTSVITLHDEIITDSSISFEIKKTNFQIFTDSTGELFSLPISEEYKKSTQTRTNKKSSTNKSGNTSEKQTYDNEKKSDSTGRENISIKDEKKASSKIADTEKSGANNAWIAYCILIVFAIIAAVSFYLYIKP